MRRTQISGLIGMGVGGAWLVASMRNPGFAWQSERITIPLILIVLGILYFLFGDRISRADRK